MYAYAELFCVLTNVSNKFVFRRFPLKGGSSLLSPPWLRPWGQRMNHYNVVAQHASTNNDT